MKFNLLSTTAVFSFACFLAAPVQSQVLDSSARPKTALDYVRAVDAAEKKELGRDIPADVSEPDIKEADAQKNDNEKKDQESIDKKEVKPTEPPKLRIVDGNVVVDNMPELKTKDGSKRGTAAFVRIPKPGEKENPNEDTQLIFLYYDNFKITRSFGGGIGCDVKFAVMTNLDQRLSNLSVKLKWPGMTTSLSFDNVNPNIETYFNYALFGEGCYTMDKIPNIIVNRCRVKGMSQEKCAAKIRWLNRK